MYRIVRRALALAALMIILASCPALACSVFFSADANQAYFCSNEDGENGNTYVWFVPAARGAYGAVFFGYEDAWVQGGMNEKGLAMDWATTEPQRMLTYPDRTSPSCNKNRLYSGNLNETILKTCATLEDVIDVYSRYNEIAFTNAHMMVADKSGASAVFEWHDGKFEVIRKSSSYQEITNFNITNAQTNGYSCVRFDAIKTRLDGAGAVSFEASRNALMAASDYLTQYSYILDLKKGVVTLYDKRNFSKAQQFVLADELAWGAHIYTTGLAAYGISPKYRSMGLVNNQNPLAVGSGKTEIYIVCAVGLAFAVLCMLFARKRRSYILPAVADLVLIPMGLGLIQYGYFLRYCFTFGQELLLVLPILLVVLAAAQVACSVVLLAGRRGRGYIPFHINTVLSSLIAAALLVTVIL